MIPGVIAAGRRPPSAFNPYDGATVVLDFENGIYMINGVVTPLAEMLVTYNVSGGVLINNWNNSEPPAKGTRALVNAIPINGISWLADYTPIESNQYASALGAMVLSIGELGTNAYAEMGIDHATNEVLVYDGWNDITNTNNFLDRYMFDVTTAGDGVRRQISVTRNITDLRASINGGAIISANEEGQHEVVADGFAIGGNFYGTQVDTYQHVHKIIIYEALTDAQLRIASG